MAQSEEILHDYLDTYMAQSPQAGYENNTW